MSLYELLVLAGLLWIAASVTRARRPRRIVRSRSRKTHPGLRATGHALAVLAGVLVRLVIAVLVAVSSVLDATARELDQIGA